MRSSSEATISLPQDLADQLAAKIAEGSYASVADIVREGLRAIEDRDAAIEHWLKTDVAAAFDAHNANPVDAVSFEDALRELDHYMDDAERKSA